MLAQISIGLCLLAQEAQPPGGLESLFRGPILPMVIVGLLFYWMVLQPERKKRAEHSVMVQNLKKNDRVLTVGGIYGTVVNSPQGSDEVTVKVDENSNTKLRISRTAITRVLSGKSDGEDAA